MTFQKRTRPPCPSPTGSLVAMPPQVRTNFEGDFTVFHPSVCVCTWMYLYGYVYLCINKDVYMCEVTRAHGSICVYIYMCVRVDYVHACACKVTRALLV